MAGADTVEYPCAIHLIRLNTTNDIIAALEVFIDSGAQKMIISTCEQSAVGVLFLDLIILFCSSEAPPCANQLIVITNPIIIAALEECC